MIRVRATLNIRSRRGQFPPASYAKVLAPARESLRRDAERAFQTQSDPVTGRAWPQRKTVRSNPMLVLSGTLRADAMRAASAATVNGSTLTARMSSPKHAGFQQGGTRLIAKRRFLGASIGTVGIVTRALKAEGLRVTRGGS